MVNDPMSLSHKFLPDCLEIRVVLFTIHQGHLQVLLVSNNEKGWQLPGGKILANLSLEKTAADCVRKITGERQTYLEQLYTYGDVSNDKETRLISIVYFALIPDATIPQTIDGFEHKWFPVSTFPVIEPAQAEVIPYALRRLRYKIEYSAVGFELLPAVFTLTDLQHTYEIILGESLDKRNFRRRILEAGVIEPTSTRKQGEGRPAQLFRYRPDAVAEVKARRLFP